MLILSFDLAEKKTGWAEGEVDERPIYDVIRLRREGGELIQSIETLAIWLRDRLERSPRPDLIVAEGFLSAGAIKGRTTFDVHDALVALNSCVRTISVCYGIPYRSPALQTIRKHFIGRATVAPRRQHKRTDKEAADDRKAMKAAILFRCKQLGYIPQDCFEDNIGDALALWDFAANHWGRKAPVLELFSYEMRQQQQSQAKTEGFNGRRYRQRNGS